MNHRFDEILNNCIERIANGEDIETCLEDYPKYCDALRSLLYVSNSATDIGRLAQPSNQSRERNFIRFNEAIHQTTFRRRTQFKLPSLRLGLAKPILLGLSAFIATTMAISITTAVSANSVPGEPLYWVKTTKETIQLKIPQSNHALAENHVNLANTRSEEIRKLVSENKYAIADNVMKRMYDHLEASANYIGVTVTVHTLEMPRESVNLHMGFEIAQFRKSLEQNVELMRYETNNIRSELSPKQSQQLEHFRRRSEFTYRMLIDAMAHHQRENQFGAFLTPPYQRVSRP